MNYYNPSCGQRVRNYYNPIWPGSQEFNTEASKSFKYAYVGNWNKEKDMAKFKNNIQVVSGSPELLVAFYEKLSKIGYSKSTNIPSLDDAKSVVSNQLGYTSILNNQQPYFSEHSGVRANRFTLPLDWDAAVKAASEKEEEELVVAGKKVEYPSKNSFKIGCQLVSQEWNNRFVELVREYNDAHEDYPIDGVIVYQESGPNSLVNISDLEKINSRWKSTR